MTFAESWIQSASALFPQALSGEPSFQPCPVVDIAPESVCLSVRLGGDLGGRFQVLLHPDLVEAPLLGDCADQRPAWIELLREVAEAAAANLLSTGQKCTIDAIEEEPVLPGPAAYAFELRAGERRWVLQVSEDVQVLSTAASSETSAAAPPSNDAVPEHRGVQLLLDVELEATLRFGCRELELGEVLNLGPGDVVQLDRHISDPVDLVVGDKIVAHGEVVLVNGNFGLRVTEVAAPRERLESIRCLF